MVNTGYQKLNNNNGEYNQKLNNNNGEYRLSKTEQQQWCIQTIKN